MHQMEQPQRGGCAMNNKLFSAAEGPRAEGKPRPAGGLAGRGGPCCSSCCRSCSPLQGRPPQQAPPRPDDNVYRQQLEQQLSDLITQVEGAGKTTVMVTLESGEETIYALDTLSGQTQEQQTHVLLDDGPRWHRQSHPQSVRGGRWCARAGEMSGSPPESPSWWGRCWMFRPTASA